MSRSRLPPTPAMSREFIIKEQPAADAPDSFALPPAALPPSKVESASRRSSRSEPSSSAYFPASPTSPDLVGLGRSASSSRQTGVKRSLEDFDLPPPPTRTRKIIQMKPKPQTAAKPAPAASKASPKESGSGKAPANNAAAANSKKKQPSATSAAGRKIARKTAHSLIERRRRSKMNEEFATLKNMIPACRGQDMHKLAILQASIDYVNYLEQCIQDLKTAGSQRPTVSPHLLPAPPSPTSPQFLGEVASATHSTSVSPKMLPSNGHTNQTSPAFSPRTCMPSTSAIEFNPAILPSPALGPIRHGSWTVPSSTITSPVIDPQFNNISGVDADIDHEASAALLMLNRDRRGTAGSIHEGVSNSPSIPEDAEKHHLQDSQKKMGMSVKDLLIA